MAKREWKEVDEVEDLALANILKGLLEAQGVSVMISQESYQQTLGLSGFPGAMVKLYVPSDQLADAEKVIEYFYSGLFYSDEGE
jgi:hypothetical protein